MGPPTHFKTTYLTICISSVKYRTEEHSSYVLRSAYFDQRKVQFSLAAMIPLARQWVQIEGRAETYIVLAVDREKRLAFVVESRGHGFVEQIRFEALLPTESNTASGD